MPGTTFLPTDLQRRYRLILDQAKLGEARVRDLDGTSILLLPETEVELLRRVNATAANLAAVERVLEGMESVESGEGTGPRPDLLQYGDWTWLRVFDYDDLRAFVHDVREAVIVAVRERSTALLDEEMRSWRVTAEQAEDPLLRAVLQAGPAQDDFTEVRRPGHVLSETTRHPSRPEAPALRPSGAQRAARGAHTAGTPRAGE